MVGDAAKTEAKRKGNVGEFLLWMEEQSVNVDTLLNPEINLTSHLSHISKTPQQYWQQLTELLIEKGGLSEYARETGKSKDTISGLKLAAEVFNKLSDRSDSLLTKSTHLSHISRTPQQYWQQLTELLIEKGGLSEYAREIGKDNSLLTKYKEGASVLQSVNIGHVSNVLDKCRHLSHISKTPPQYWQQLTSKGV